jgi:hypothetical protein
VTREDLEALIATRRRMKVAEGLAGLSEAERRRLSEAAFEIYRAVRRAWNEEKLSKQEAALVSHLRAIDSKHDARALSEYGEAAEIAVLGLCPISKARRIRFEFWNRHETHESVTRVLFDRRPVWIADWVEHCLDQEFAEISWATLRTLVLEGVCPRPASEAYYRFAAREMAGTVWIRKPKPYVLTDALRSSPDLLDDVWGFFRVETRAFSETGNHWDGTHHETWREAVVELSRRGLLDRDRLLDESLAGMSTGFRPVTLSGFAKVHELLGPTVDEIDARQVAYLDLLSIQAATAIALGLRMLKILSKAGRLDGAAFLGASGAVFDQPAKGHATTALTMARAAVKARPELAGQGAALAVAALRHESADVAEAGLALLESWRGSLDAAVGDEGVDIGAAVAETLDDLPATLRERAQTLAAALGGVGDRHETDREVDITPAALNELRARAGALPRRWRDLAGVDEAIGAAEEGRLAAPMGFDLIDVPVLSGVEAIEPIASVDELLDRVAHVLEVDPTAEEIERIIDGISRLCALRPDDFELRAAPLLKRMDDALPPDLPARELQYFREWSPAWPFLHLLTCWLALDRVKKDPKPLHKLGPMACFERCLLELCDRVRRREAGPHLSAPTHRHGWIDPVVFVERLREVQKAGRTPDQHDLTHAILRLAPDRRPEALRHAQAVRGRVGKPVRWALGGSQLPKRKLDKFGPIWIAALRCRAPREVVEVRQEFADGGPDGYLPATYKWRPRVRFLGSRDDPWAWAHRVRHLDIRTTPPVTNADWVPDVPTVAMHTRKRRLDRFGSFNPLQVRWEPLVWPLVADSALAVGARCIATLNEAVSATPCHMYLEPLSQVDRPWSDMARLTLLSGLTAACNDLRAHAIDALIDGIDDGRAHPGPVGETLAGLNIPGWLKLNRVSAALGEVARVSPLHALFVAGCLDRLIASCKELPRDLHHVLALQLELLTQLGLPLSEDAVARLAETKGSSKGAKLARALIGHRPDAPTPAHHAALARVAEARVERAERWASAADGMPEQPTESASRSATGRGTSR